jgi:phage host-nuclease inhibitor protein Gam
MNSHPKTNTMPAKKSSLLIAKVRIEPIRDRDEATAIAAGTARLILEQEKSALIRDERLEALKAEFNLQIEEFGREIEKNTKRLSQWALANREREFGDKKSITLAGHKLAFREGTGKVEFATGTKEAEALDAILAAEDDAVIERFVAIKTSLDKNAVLAAWRASETLREFLGNCGVRVVKEEKFSFEPDRDALAEAAPVVTGKEAA